MSRLYVNDGYSLTKTVPAAPGLHDRAEIVYRPALDQERYAWRAKLDGKDPKAVSDYLTDLIARHVVTVNGATLDRAKCQGLHPNLRTLALDLILSYEPSDDATPPPEAGAGNSCGRSELS